MTGATLLPVLTGMLSSFFPFKIDVHRVFYHSCRFKRPLIRRGLCQSPSLACSQPEHNSWTKTLLACNVFDICVLHITCILFLITKNTRHTHRKTDQQLPNSLAIIETCTCPLKTEARRMRRQLKSQSHIHTLVHTWATSFCSKYFFGFAVLQVFQGFWFSHGQTRYFAKSSTTRKRLK